MGPSFRSKSKLIPFYFYISMCILNPNFTSQNELLQKTMVFAFKVAKIDTRK